MCKKVKKKVLTVSKPSKVFFKNNYYSIGR